MAPVMRGRQSSPIAWLLVLVFNFAKSAVELNMKAAVGCRIDVAEFEESRLEAGRAGNGVREVPLLLFGINSLINLFPPYFLHLASRPSACLVSAHSPFDGPVQLLNSSRVDQHGLGRLVCAERTIFECYRAPPIPSNAVVSDWQRTSIGARPAAPA
ncbi:hypothetical protein C8R43DRAFT_1124889 [Mycena crocata]|nr:hypothetical protein C8R43DRAFT_1124889 [Mycena crocata]